jgi:Outer membrane protein beta-barrel domain
MKSAKIFLVSTLLIVSGFVAKAQKAEVGLSGGVATTWLMNKNVFDYGPSLDPVASVGGNYGLAATVYFTKKVGLGIELNNSIVNQKYKGTVLGSSYNTKTKLTFLDVPLLLKLKSGESGFYFEIGPKLSYILTATETTNSSVGNLAFAGGTVKSDFNNTVISGVLGIGGRINIVDAITLSIGARFNGAFTDVTKESSTAAGLSSTSGEAANVASDGTLDYKRTTLASAGIQIGILYRIGK